MKTKRVLLFTIVALLAATMSLGWSPALKTAEAGAKAEWKFHDIVSVNFVQQNVKIPKPDNVMRVIA